MTPLLRSYGETDFVTGLRAIAALMVIAIHTAAFRDFGTLGNVITDNGKYGVQIFFVISGFTIARTYRSAPSFFPYFARRLIRIVPLYFAVILTVFYLLRTGTIAQGHWMTLYGSEPDAYNLLMHLTFLSAWDTRVANSFLGVEWSIPIEMFWYLALPLLLPVAASLRNKVIIFAGLLGLSGLTRAVAHVSLPDHAAHFLPLTYGAYFYLGAMSDGWRDKLHKWPTRFRKRLVLASGMLFVATLCVDTGMNAALFAIATAVLIAAHRGTSGSIGLLTLRPMILLGSISYSLYLTHPLVLTGLPYLVDVALFSQLYVFALTVAITTAVSISTYLIIERPPNRWCARYFAQTRTRHA